MSSIQLAEGDITHVKFVLNVAIIILWIEVFRRLILLLSHRESISHFLIKGLELLVLYDNLGLLRVDEHLLPCLLLVAL